ncbi:hypothetical protein Tco_1224561 [Tanacetum coccineum]
MPTTGPFPFWVWIFRVVSVVEDMIITLTIKICSTIKSKEPTLQVVLDALKLTSFYKAFEITVGVPEIYMKEFWVTASRHHSSLHFKMNDKSHTINIDNSRDMLQICPKLPSQKFKDPPFEEEILSFIRDLGHTGEIKVLSDVNVNYMHQPWRSFAAIINKCLSGKTTALESLCLSRAQILWGMYHNKNVDYVYLLWEDLVYQVENKNSKKNNDMCYLRFTKVIVDYFMPKDQSILRRNKMFWHTHLTNQTMLESKAYKTYHSYATGEKIPKPKYVKNKANPESYPTKKYAQASKGKRLKTLTKVAKPAKKKQPATTSKAKDADEGTSVSPRVPDVPTYNFEDEQISWKSSDEDNDDEANMSEHDNDQDDDNADNEGDDDQDDDNEQTESDNNDDDFWSDDEAYDEETQGDNDEKEELDEEETNEEEEANELYRDVNVNLEGRDTKMTDTLLANVQTTQVIEDTHVIITVVTPEVQ